MGEHLVEPAFAAIRAANRGTLSEETLKEAFSDCWRLPLDFVANKYGFSHDMPKPVGTFFSHDCRNSDEGLQRS
jgi:hypothetical protein